LERERDATLGHPFSAAAGSSLASRWFAGHCEVAANFTNQYNGSRARF
jgi:hypothetical protein